MIKIAIDAGHGLKTAGKRCMKKIDPNQTREWFLNDRIADKLEELLKSYNCQVIRTDDTTGKTDVSLKERVKKANSWNADIFISIHHNAGAKGTTAGGTVVYYYGSNVERKKRADALYNAVIAETNLIGNRAKKVKQSGFYVIKNTTMPALLLENGFMDSLTDTPIILTEDHATKTARGLLNFLVEWFELSKGSEEKEKPERFRIKITTPQLNYRSGPGRDYPARGTVKKGEVFTIVETSGSWGKLKSGAGWINISEDYVKRL